MTTKQDVPLTKAERLAIGGAVAPIVRRQADAPRRVTLVDKDGNPVGVTTSTEVAKSLLARSEIEFSVQPGKRPEFVICKDCGRPVPVGIKGPLPKVCRGGTHKCSNCGAPVRSRSGTCAYGKKCKRCSATDSVRKIPRRQSRCSDEQLIEAVRQCSTINAAARQLGLAIEFVRRRAKVLGVESDNPSYLSEIRRVAGKRGAAAFLANKTSQQSAPTEAA